MRYVLEGEWTGYRSSQQHIVHREVIPSWARSRISRLKELHAIRFTDGTSLIISLRQALPREKVSAINGYNSLIRDAESFTGSHVSLEQIIALRK